MRDISDWSERRGYNHRLTAKEAEDVGEFMELMVPWVPIVGQFQDVYEALLGYEMFTGKDLDAMDRALAIAGMVGVFAELVQGARKLTATGKIAAALEEDARLAVRAADEVRQATTGAVRSAATLQYLEALERLDESVDALRRDAYGRFLSAVSGTADRLGKLDDVNDIAMKIFGPFTEPSVVGPDVDPSMSVGPDFDPSVVGPDVDPSMSVGPDFDPSVVGPDNSSSRSPR
ncbi:hypothetical protein J5X84_22205 [Streptosporangiaceae bacterium NEAU-GS5]|nr:hypothetical protein [Streptosporangiaceae bacterium NEAU-GS5]